jgi:serine/threonine protein kinase
MEQRHDLAQESGQVLGRRYQIVRPLGSGGMATTYLVRDLVLEREVALKLLQLPGSDALRMFRDEFARLSGLFHPHLSRVHDFGTELGERDRIHFYTADLVPGATLDRYAVARSWTEVARPLCDALHALAFLHSLDTRHGDFKPQNVMVASDGRGTLIDLGCAAPLRERAHTLSGTPAYLAPELLSGDPTDTRTDLYSVGVTIDELSRRVAGSLPRDVRRLADRLTRHHRHERPSEVTEILELLGDRRQVQRAPRGIRESSGASASSDAATPRSTRCWRAAPARARCCCSAPRAWARAACSTR